MHYKSPTASYITNQLPQYNGERNVYCSFIQSSFCIQCLENSQCYDHVICARTIMNENDWMQLQ